MIKFVVLHIFHPNKKLVYFLKKNKPSMPQLHNKWVGFGGKVEDFDKNIFDTTIREIKEELKIELKRKNLKLRGSLFDSKNNHIVYILTTEYDKILKEGLIEKEGIAKYLSLDYPKKHPKKFPWGNLNYFEKLFFTKKNIKIIL